MKLVGGVVRFLGWLFLAVMLLAIGAEALISLRAGKWELLSLGELWYSLDPASLNLLQAVSQRYIHPVIWDPGAIIILQLPVWLVALIIAVFLFVLTRRRRAFKFRRSKFQ